MDYILIGLQAQQTRKQADQNKEIKPNPKIK
jgi:hypothetical protein